MVAVKANAADRFAANPPAGIRLFLVHGVDAGGVTDRARRLEQAALKRGGADMVTRFGSDEISADPARLADEANSGSLFGGEAVIALRILDGRHNVLGPLAALIERPPDAAWVIVEAGELKRDSALVRAFEASPAAAAVPTYPMDGADLRAMVAEAARESGVALDPEAAEALVEVLAGDRLAARGELEKLFLYVADEGRATAADVAAIVGDLVEARIDAIADAALSGDPDAVEAGLLRLRAEGGSAASLLSGVLRHLAQLTALSAAMQTDGVNAAEAIRRARPPVNFRRQTAVRAQLEGWRAGDLTRARRLVAEAILTTRKQAALDMAVASAALHRLAGRG